MSKEKIEQTKKAAMVFFFAVAAFLSAWYKFVSPLEKPFHKTLNQTAKGTKATIVIDPGHGGFDPGKVGANQTLEKDVNLAISEKLNQKLAASGYTVYMTRVSDEALCRGDESSKKRADMQNRVALIEEKKPDLVVSIHQNSFSASTKGAQVFYQASCRYFTAVHQRKSGQRKPPCGKSECQLLYASEGELSDCYRRVRIFVKS